ncbi:MAG TPA: hypothetical protein DCW90_08685 [Lachnospiraceae bacterium]|nr:hypothetical protein [Lachnospiraceae bacterium]
MMRTLYQVAMDDSPSPLKDNGITVFKILPLIGERHIKITIGQGNMTAVCCDSFLNVHTTDEYRLEESYEPIRNLQQRSFPTTRKPKTLKRKSAVYY